MINNKRIHSIHDILNEEVKLYKTLYTASNDNVNNTDTYLETINIPITLSYTEADICEGLISTEECKEALFDLKLN